MNMVTKEKFSVRCADGVELKGVLLIPDSPKAIVQFNGGTATKKEFYLPFLEYLASHNYLCCLWDYRGSGESAPKNMAECDYTFRDYGMKDMPAIKDYLTERFPDLPLLLFAHSVGGQQVGFMNNHEGYTGMVGFAISTGYLSHMPIGYRLISIFFFHIFTPISIWLTGYVKAKTFGIMENLPKNVAVEWRDWCMKANYFFDKKFFGKTVPEGSFKRITYPIHVFWTTDDPISNKRSVPTFWSNVTSDESISFTKLSPNALNVKKIGHFGFFKKSMKFMLWSKGLDNLDKFLDNKPTTI